MCEYTTIYMFNIYVQCIPFFFFFFLRFLIKDKILRTLRPPLNGCISVAVVCLLVVCLKFFLIFILFLFFFPSPLIHWAYVFPQHTPLQKPLSPSLFPQGPLNYCGSVPALTCDPRISIISHFSCRCYFLFFVDHFSVCCIVWYYPCFIVVLLPQ